MESALIKCIGKSVINGNLFHLHHDMFLFLIPILVFVSRMLVRTFRATGIAHGTWMNNSSFFITFLVAFQSWEVFGSSPAECMEPGNEADRNECPSGSGTAGPSRSAEKTSPAGNFVHTMDPADGGGPSNPPMDFSPTMKAPPVANPSGQLLPNASETPHSDASGSPGKSALEDMEEERLLDDLQDKKGDLGEGQRLSGFRRSVDQIFGVTTPGGKFELIQNLRKETGGYLADAPVTRSMFNVVREHQSRNSSGRGGGKTPE
jgi:hypothetical protein